MKKKSQTLHIRLSELIRSQIEDGLYPAGHQLPSELDIMSKHDVSRITARRVLANLISQGLAEAHQGKGVFVKDRNKFIQSLYNPLRFINDELSSQNATGGVKFLSLSEVSDPEAKENLQLPHKSKLLLLRKIILINDSPVAIDNAFIEKKLVDNIIEELKNHFLFQTLDKYNFKIHKVHSLIECAHSTNDESQYLEIPIGTPLLVNNYLAFSKEKPIVSGFLQARGDRLSYSVILDREGFD
jgi:DNA-binding GntR family transcriptional regulator